MNAVTFSKAAVAKNQANRHVASIVFSPSPKSAPKSVAHVEPPHSRRQPIARLSPAMACDAAFRIIARGFLKQLTANHRGTCAGDADALHEMRLALTRLRTMISFFSPMVAGPQRTRIHEQLKWLNSHLGVVRDLDVALERLKEFDERHPQADYRSWSRERDQSQRHLTRALQSTRYRQLATSTSDWIERGSWLNKQGDRAAAQRACPITEYGARKLQRWQERLIKKSRKLQDMGVKKRHRLRLLNKKLCYAIETIAEVVSNDEISRQQVVKYLRKAQRALGQLNDDAQGRALAATMGRSGIRASQHFLSPKREKRLLRSAALAYRKLAELEPFRT